MELMIRIDLFAGSDVARFRRRRNGAGSMDITDIGRIMDRRRFLSLAPAAAAASATSALPALAAAPLAGSAPPGFYRMKLGDYELTVLLDGTVPVPLTALYNNTSPERVEEGLAAAFLRSPVDLSVNAF